MKKKRVVVLYGASLFIAGVETCLKDQPGIDAIRLDNTLPNIQMRYKSLCPDVVIFDSSDATLPTLPRITQLLKECPDAQAIGLDLNTNNKVTVFSSQQRLVTKAEDLIEAIQNGRKSTNSIATEDSGETERREIIGRK